MKTIYKMLPIALLCLGCKGGEEKPEVVLLTLDPGHFHAALVQKTQYPQVSKDVYVYAPAGEDLESHLAKVEAYNQRAEAPTSWNEIVYRGEDFLDKMIAEKKGNVMVTAGNNAKNTLMPVPPVHNDGANSIGKTPFLRAVRILDLLNCFLKDS